MAPTDSRDAGRQPGGVGRGDGDVGERLVGHEDLGAGVLEDVGDLVRRQVRVQRDVAPARLEDREEQGEELGRVAHSDATTSPSTRPRARSPWTSWLAPASNSPAVHELPSESMTAMRDGSSRAAAQKPLGAPPTASPIVSLSSFESPSFRPPEYSTTRDRM